MKLPGYFLFVPVLLLSCSSYAQSVKNTDGTPVNTRYCYENKDYGMVGQPSGGTFSGCGVEQANGIWNFNPVRAANGVTVFPFQCMVQYTVNGSTVNVPFLVWKPVIIHPPLKDTFTCNGAFLLHAGTLYAGSYQYKWSPAAVLATPDQPVTTGQINATQTFVLTATDASSGCAGSDSLIVTKDNYPDLQVSADVTIINREQTQLSVSGAQTYKWSPALSLSNPNVANPVATPKETTTYTVTGRSEYGCYSEAKVTVTVDNRIFIPNAFSPNGDGVNDEFKIVNYGFDEVLEYRIFDRWGKELFSTFNGNAAWDGTYKGQPLEVGTYYYVITISYKKGPPVTQKGDLALVR